MRGREQGMALVIVLWISMLLALLAGSFAFSVRTETRVVAGIKERAEARALAEAVVSWVSIGMLQWQPEERPFQLNGEPYVWPFARREVSVRATEASGRLNPNSTSRETLVLALRYAGVPADSEDALADAIIDWRDSDDARGLNGAEAPDYERAGVVPGPKDAPYDSIDELGQVLGMSADILERLRPVLTLHGSGAVDPTFAPREVLLMLSMGDTELVDDVVASDNADVTQRSPWEGYETGESGYLHLDISVSFDGGSRYLFSAVVSPAQATELMPILEWREH